MSKRDWLQDRWENLKSKSHHTAERLLDSNVRLAVTGLSGAGKTAFITSVVNQLLNIDNGAHLNGFSPRARIEAIKIDDHPQLHIPQFSYSSAMELLNRELPQWPESTYQVSQIRLKIRYTVDNKIIRTALEHATLTIDIVDYPGEWLLDLAMLNLDFSQWSEQCLDHFERFESMVEYRDWIDYSQQLTSSTMVDDISQQECAKLYKKFLHRLSENKSNKLYVQPGRFVMPADLEGSPMLDFWPCLFVESNEPLQHKLEQRFTYYKEHVVLPFFKEYFEKVDRQIVLLDGLDILNNGALAYERSKRTLEQLLSVYQYGSSNWFKRLFSPKIDKLLLAFSQSDQIHPSQLYRYEDVMNSMVRDAKNSTKFDGTKTDSMALSSIVVTEAVTAELEGKQVPALRGRDQNGQQVVSFSGEIPDVPINKNFWHALDFKAINYLPSPFEQSALPHYRLDKALEFLIGDKFL